MHAQVPSIDSLSMGFDHYERDDDLYLRYEKAKFQFDSLRLYDRNIELRQSHREDLKLAYGKMLNLENYSSLPLQNALLKDYFIKYREQPLKVKFDNREQVESRIGMFDEAYVATITLMYLKNLKNFWELHVQKMDEYIDRNLKRLNVSKKEFEDLSDNDKELLWKEFK
ncbi:hypothetical protein [Chryseobacterium sp.]|uniref:hypothetical protein n=1 Tax=Chryseobacterium sp. TaxID=1871047 RepID=UPI0025C60EB7|nr:hypothetical protein [Chryseobacterium sp.]MBV8326623.1 hypothetical protein [Chryseobacterium sp.]